MSDIVIRGVDDELVKQIRIAAARNGQSLKMYVTEVLETAVGWELLYKDLLKKKEVPSGNGRDGVRMWGSVEGGAERQGQKGTRESGKAVSGAHDEAGPPDQSSAVDRGSAQNRVGERKGQETAISLTGTRAEHDPKTCRVYGCGGCRVLGVKDAQRGLK